MNDLLKKMLGAHGGLERWQTIRKISADFSPSGIALVARGQEAFTKMSTRVDVDTRAQRVSIFPFLHLNQRARYEPYRTLVESSDGRVLEKLERPRASFGNSAAGAKWSANQLAYFIGCALWTYFTLPFSLVGHGVIVRQGELWTESAEEIWQTLELTFPEAYATHSSQQTIYIDASGLIRRHDYSLEIAGNSKAAHYLLDYQVFDGFAFPTKRRNFLRDERRPLKDRLVIQADLGNYELTY